ncbi:hypothetical protein ACFLRM_01785 [Acidobacteriota bacterium]
MKSSKKISPIVHDFVFCFFVLLLFGAGLSFAPSLDKAGVSPECQKVTRMKQRLGPFLVGDREFTVLLRKKKIEGVPEGFDETVKSFSIVDDQGVLHYQKSFQVTIGEKMFDETIGIWAFTLESVGRKIFRKKAGLLKEQTVNEGEACGLVLYFGISPSAPSSGVSCQVFALSAERLVPLFEPLTVYGRIHDLPEGNGTMARRLLEENTMRFGVWTGWFEVTVPVKVLEVLRVIPRYHHKTFGLDAFDVVVERRPSEQETFVRLFEYPGDSMPRHVVVKKESKVEFLQAYTKVSFESGRGETVISLPEMPWLKVRINGMEGFVKDEEDLMALGLRPAG